MKIEILNLDSKTFRDTYFLKEELVQFCKDNGLPIFGSKIELTEIISYYLDTGKIISSKKERIVNSAKRNTAFKIDERDLIETDFVCTEQHRAFFKERIGKSFSFNVNFQKWLKLNSGKTYKDAIAAYGKIIEAKKSTKSVIDKQFEYNTYIRDFFANNKGKSLGDAIKCWNYKKAQTGKHCYETEDLVVLKG